MTAPKKEEDKLSIVKLSGEAETKGGKLTRAKYFDFLSFKLDDYTDLSFTEEQANRISNHIAKLQTGSTAMVPLHCGGKEFCPFASRCPLIQMDKSNQIVGKMCLIETQMLNYWIMQYMEEYSVDPENFTEVGFCNELAEIEVYLWRLNQNLAKPENAELMINQTVAISNDGVPIIQKQLSPFMDQKEKLFNRKAKIIKLMVGDRQERYKKEAALKQKEEKDPSSIQAAMRRKIEALHRQLNQVESNLGKEQEEDSTILTPDSILDAIDE